MFENGITAECKFTAAPSRYSEATHVKKLEELGIGRPSTYAPTISTIQQRGYVEKGNKSGTTRKYNILTLNNGNIIAKEGKENVGAEKAKLLPTDIGIVVNDFLLDFFPEIMDYNFTATVEKDFDEIADGKREGDVEAAKEAFASLGRVAGAAISTAVTIIDGLVVIGGGVSAASHWIMPALLEEMRSKLRTLGGDEVNLVQMNVYNLEDDAEFAQFAQGEVKKVKVYGEERYVDYDSRKRIGIAISKLGASKAVSVGAYAFALSELDKR